MSDRRAFLRHALGASVAGVAGAAAGAGVTAAVTGGSPAAAAPADSPLAAVPFHGAHQTGITTPAQQHASVLALDLEVTDRASVEELFRTITDRARFLTTGGTPPDPGIAAP